MRVVPLAGALIGALATMIACENPAPPTGPNATIASDRAGGGCAKRPDFVVTDETSLVNALNAAKPGAVIAVSGFFGISTDVLILTDGITITCATPGSGLYALPGGGVYDIIEALANKTTADHLVLDATQALDGAFVAYVDNVTYFGNNARFTNNTVTCAPTFGCIDDLGGAEMVMSDNHFQADQPLVGIEIQSNVDVNNNEIFPVGVRVERNTLVATSAGPGANFGAIRPYAATKAVIANNEISGPWDHGISFKRGGSSKITGNQIRGVLQYGIRMATNGEVQRNDRFLANRIKGSGVAGIFVSYACGNLFANNDLRGNAGNIGIFFDVTSGANTVRGDDATGFLITDNGAFDCDGDGVNDPNIIKADDAVVHGGVVVAMIASPSAAVRAVGKGAVTTRVGRVIQ